MSWKCKVDLSAIEPRLRDVGAGGQESLVLMNPCSMYRLNDRVDDC
jgi:hypothetical protein